MLDISHVDLRAGDLVELKQDQFAAATIVREALPGTVRETDISIFRAKCPRCANVALFTVKA